VFEELFVAIDTDVTEIVEISSPAVSKPCAIRSSSKASFVIFVIRFISINSTITISVIFFL
jgi:cobalamin biosynthesis protein CbiG